tara:strand:- start:2270 stop:2641 length:372 start_codon:yes stop_codon:yes gene_type:complete
VTAARILVVDDDSVSRAILREILEKEGLQVVEATNSDEGIQTYKAEPIDVVVTDLFMPEKGGLDVIGKVREFDPDARLIVVSGIDLREKFDIFRLAEQLGAMSTLQKPVKPEVLIESVWAALA